VTRGGKGAFRATAIERSGEPSAGTGRARCTRAAPTPSAHRSRTATLLPALLVGLLVGLAPSRIGNS
jgi:hypothetical protein